MCVDWSDGAWALCSRGPPASLLWTLVLLVSFSEAQLQLSAPEAVTLQQHQQGTVHISSSIPLNETVLLLLNVTSTSSSNWSSVVSLPQEVPLSAGSTGASFNVSALAVGQVTAVFRSNRSDLSGPLRIRFLVIHSSVLDLLSQVIGWIYFLAWSVSFYPQAWENWTRKSVVGLNLDFLALNLTGFIAYSVFNIGLFWVQPIKEEFLKRDPNAVNPVTASDVFFSLHAVILCALYVCQAALYQRGGQTISWPARGLLLLGWTFALVSLVLAIARVISWLQYIYYFSYIKLAVTLVKYVPQAYMNYRRRSTVGWSIGNVLLDFTGGTLSILQMVLQSYNNDQWMLVFGNPTKFGLGLFSVLFDLVFISQHYCLYRAQYQSLPSEEPRPDQDGTEPGLHQV
ncbi:cystinosin [Eucyclogobius newberryi]|uniref:cystinosin n=1 Tax=Eucyclogobius newberryi TaxID=166745 RepID=UPI003B5B4A96